MAQEGTFTTNLLCPFCSNLRKTVNRSACWPKCESQGYRRAQRPPLTPQHGRGADLSFLPYPLHRTQFDEQGSERIRLNPSCNASKPTSLEGTTYPSQRGCSMGAHPPECVAWLQTTPRRGLGAEGREVQLRAYGLKGRLSPPRPKPVTL